jgi:hypothetical protein
MQKNKKSNGKFNVIAILSLIFAFLLAPIGIILGIVSLVQIKKTKENGYWMAIVGIIVGSLLTALGIILLLGISLFALGVSNSQKDCDISNHTQLQEFINQTVELRKNYSFIINYSNENTMINSSSAIKIVSFRLISGFDIPRHIILNGQITYKNQSYNFEKLLAYRQRNYSSNSSEMIVVIDEFSKAFDNKDIYRDFDC